MLSEPLFFLSYSRANAEGGWVDKFFGDLCREVGELTGISRPQVGFMDDRSIPVGARWTVELGEALRSCRVFVPLYSPDFFQSEYCGKEWRAFESRCRVHTRGASAPPNLIVPALWVPPKDNWIPPSCRTIQYKTAEFGEHYPIEGISYFLRHDHRQHGDYVAFLRSFAEALIAAHQTIELPAHHEPFDFDGLAPAFPLPAAALEPVSRVPHEPKRVYFVVLAGSAEEMASLRGDAAEAYGAAGQDWRPYFPEIDEPIGLWAQAVAAGERLLAYFLEASETLVERLDGADLQYDVVAILADPWSVRVAPLNRLLEGYDRRDFLNCALLIPWNRSDEATRRHEQELTRELQTALRSKSFGYQDPASFRQRIESVGELRGALQTALVEVQSRLMKSQGLAVPRPIPKTGPARAPSLGARPAGWSS